MQIVALGRTHLKKRLLQCEQSQDVSPHPRRRGGAECHHRHTRTELPDLSETAIVGPEIMPPGTDAVGFIHSQCHQALLGMGQGNQIPNLAGLQPLRSQIQQAKLPLSEGPPNLLANVAFQPCVQTRRRDLPTAQLTNLILHQCHQW